MRYFFNNKKTALGESGLFWERIFGYEKNTFGREERSHVIDYVSSIKWLD